MYNTIDIDKCFVMICIYIHRYIPIDSITDPTSFLFPTLSKTIQQTLMNSDSSLDIVYSIRCAIDG